MPAIHEVATLTSKGEFSLPKSIRQAEPQAPNRPTACFGGPQPKINRMRRHTENRGLSPIYGRPASNLSPGSDRNDSSLPSRPLRWQVTQMKRQVRQDDTGRRGMAAAEPHTEQHNWKSAENRGLSLINFIN